jgi:hypothetical protein
VSDLLAKNVSILALGLGYGADIDKLDLLDDNIANNSAKRVLKPSTLTAGLSASVISNVKKVEIYVNQTLVKTILAKDLTSTPVGLKYELDLTTLIIGSDDTVEARVIADDTVATFASAKLTIAE